MNYLFHLKRYLILIKYAYHIEFIILLFIYIEILFS